jgi:hypothetical protein
MSLDYSTDSAVEHFAEFSRAGGRFGYATLPLAKSHPVGCRYEDGAHSQGAALDVQGQVSGASSGCG